MSERLSLAAAGMLHLLLAVWLLAVAMPMEEPPPRPAPAAAVELLMVDPELAPSEDRPAEALVPLGAESGDVSPAPAPSYLPSSPPEPITPAIPSNIPTPSQTSQPVTEVAPVTVAPQAIAAPAVESALKPPSPPSPPVVRRRTFDADRLSSMLDRANPVRKKPALKSGELSSLLEKSLPKGSARLNSFQAASLEASIRAQITPCWNLPTAPDGAGNVVVLLKIQLRTDGSLLSIPDVLSVKGVTASTAAYGRAMASSVRRAVSLCSPLKLPAEHYESWREIELNFDPSQIL